MCVCVCVCVCVFVCVCIIHTGAELPELSSYNFPVSFGPPLSSLRHGTDTLRLQSLRAPLPPAQGRVTRRKPARKGPV
jgi:hypothetical protein